MLMRRERMEKRSVGGGLRTAAPASAVVAALLCMAGGVAAADLTLKYSDHDPLGGMRTQFVQDVWLPEIVAQSGDTIEVQDFWGGALLGSKEILKGISDGVTDMGFVFPGHYPNQLVAHSIFSMFPRGPETFENMAWFYRKAYEEVPAFEAELERAGVMTLLFTAGLPGAFTGKNPLTGIDDIKGDKWRAGGKWLLRYLENAGATPVSVPWGDVYVALQTGTIDGCFTNYDGLHLMKFDEVAPNLLISRELWYATPFLHLINKRAFDGLSEDTQAALLKAAKEAEAKFGATYDAAFEQVKSEQIAAGYTVTEMSADDVLKWENAEVLAELQAEWVEEAEDAGLEGAAEIMDQVSAIHREAMAR